MVRSYTPRSFDVAMQTTTILPYGAPRRAMTSTPCPATTLQRTAMRLTTDETMLRLMVRSCPRRLRPVAVFCRVSTDDYPAGGRNGSWRAGNVRSIGKDKVGRNHPVAKLRMSAEECRALIDIPGSYACQVACNL